MVVGCCARVETPPAIQQRAHESAAALHAYDGEEEGSNEGRLAPKLVLSAVSHSLKVGEQTVVWEILSPLPEGRDAVVTMIAHDVFVEEQYVRDLAGGEADFLIHNPPIRDLDHACDWGFQATLAPHGIATTRLPEGGLRKTSSIGFRQPGVYVLRSTWWVYDGDDRRVITSDLLRIGVERELPETPLRESQSEAHREILEQPFPNLFPAIAEPPRGESAPTYAPCPGPASTYNEYERQADPEQ